MAMMTFAYHIMKMTTIIAPVMLTKKEEQTRIPLLMIVVGVVMSSRMVMRWRQ